MTKHSSQSGKKSGVTAFEIGVDNITIPKTNYVIDNHGQKMFVQLGVQDWENFLSKVQHIESMLALKNKLKNAFSEVRQIQRGEKQGTTLNDFLNEL